MTRPDRIEPPPQYGNDRRMDGIWETLLDVRDSLRAEIGPEGAPHAAFAAARLDAMLRDEHSDDDTSGDLIRAIERWDDLERGCGTPMDARVAAGLPRGSKPATRVARAMDCLDRFLEYDMKQVVEDLTLSAFETELRPNAPDNLDLISAVGDADRALRRLRAFAEQMKAAMPSVRGGREMTSETRNALILAQDLWNAQGRGTPDAAFYIIFEAIYEALTGKEFARMQTIRQHVQRLSREEIARLKAR